MSLKSIQMLAVFNLLEMLKEATIKKCNIYLVRGSEFNQLIVTTIVTPIVKSDWKNCFEFDTNRLSEPDDPFSEMILIEQNCLPSNENQKSEILMMMDSNVLSQMCKSLLNDSISVLLSLVQ